MPNTEPWVARFRAACPHPLEHRRYASQYPVSYDSEIGCALCGAVVEILPDDVLPPQIRQNRENAESAARAREAHVAAGGQSVADWAREQRAERDARAAGALMDATLRALGGRR